MKYRILNMYGHAQSDAPLLSLAETQVCSVFIYVLSLQQKQIYIYIYFFFYKDLQPMRAYIYIFFCTDTDIYTYKMVCVDLSLPGLELCSLMDVGVCLLI